MMSKQLVCGMRLKEQLSNDCLDCSLNKCKRASHPPRTSVKATKPGVSLHFDLIGPIKPVGLEGQRFILVCRDEMSKLRMVSCLKTKGQTSEQIKLMINKTELETGNSVLCITSDNGSEFKSDRLAVFLEHKGINHNFSASYTPQQNGTVERENGKLLVQSRTILNASRLGLQLWPEAVATSTYVSNRCISNLSDITPFEIWYKRKPDINNLEIFGQMASVLKLDNERTKFDARAKIRYFVGYTDLSNTFKFFDIESKAITTSCDATFLQQIGPQQERVVAPVTTTPHSSESTTRPFCFEIQPTEQISAGMQSDSSRKSPGVSNNPEQHDSDNELYITIGDNETQQVEEWPQELNNSFDMGNIVDSLTDYANKDSNLMNNMSPNVFDTSADELLNDQEIETSSSLAPVQDNQFKLQNEALEPDRKSVV